MARYIHHYPQPQKKRRGYSNLITPEIRAKRELQRSRDFQSFVEHNQETMTDIALLYKLHKEKYVQLEFAF